MPEHEPTWGDKVVQTIWRPAAIVLGVGLPITYIIYTRVIGKRFPTSGHIPPEAFTSQQYIRGRVVSVGDSDNFRLYHTPGLGWGWARRIPTTRKELTNQTIPIRLAGVDAPEGSHFGMPAQPLSSESKEFLTSMVLNRNVKVQLLSRDQYQRVVAMAYVRNPPFYRLKNVSVEMCKAGMASIYTAKGAQYAGQFEVLKQTESRAK
ncbi:hypothetical protein BDB00DRAFT_886488 [Zychaea mexicana]|uniref:uncharacterized protein n=1 Tax=Zychaea mexicana TaxID=64656 RepID=UPI0022FDEAEA|nr:uncharacterized protein BDB00DRAFT_886488 [Zychaea mexicana]KAI9497220.1 hypothetical protein BDB00DRAFT_886488 [Zychaea mexicana]